MPEYEERWQKLLRGLPPDALVAGVDEVGRGPLAGDVVAAAVILGCAADVAGLKDSKALSAARREVLAELIVNTAASVSIGRASPREIDQINILQATMLAMTRAVKGLALQPALVLVDGNRLPAWRYTACAVVKGDTKIPEISAASIVAKVQRDGEMAQLHEQWPAYGFAAHKGYPTRAHLQALAEFGPIHAHRLSFAPVRDAVRRQSERRETLEANAIHD